MPRMTPVSSGHPAPQNATRRVEELRAEWMRAEPCWEEHAWALAAALRAVLASPGEPTTAARAEVAQDAFAHATQAFIAAGNAWAEHVGIPSAAE